MADDDVPTDVSVPETLGGTLGAVPPPPRSSDESAVFTDASRDVAFAAGAPHESRVARFVSWLRWAAAPLGFFLFLAGLTAFGLLKDESSTDTDDQPAANVMPATAVVPTTTPPPATTAMTTPEPPTTVAPEPPTTAAPPPTEPPPTEPPPTAPPATLPPSASTASPAAPAAPRYGPVCGYRPGQTVRLTINGRPAASPCASHVPAGHPVRSASVFSAMAKRCPTTPDPRGSRWRRRTAPDAGNVGVRSRSNI